MIDIIVGIILLVAAIFLTVAILMQEGKSARLSGAIAGGADTFFGKTKGHAISKKLSTITTIVAICFTVVVLVLYILQPNPNKIDPGKYDPNDPDAVVSSEVASDKASEKASEKTSEKTSGTASSGAASEASGEASGAE